MDSPAIQPSRAPDFDTYDIPICDPFSEKRYGAKVDQQILLAVLDGKVVKPGGQEGQEDADGEEHEARWKVRQEDCQQEEKSRQPVKDSKPGPALGMVISAGCSVHSGSTYSVRSVQFDHFALVA